MNTGRQDLLGAVGEEEFARQLKRWAARAGWCGYHVRYSQAVVEGVHTTRHDGHGDAFGIPDWIFAKAGYPLILPELKASAGRVSKDQKRWLEVLNQATGVLAPVWRPDMESDIKRVLGV
jgi:hypothetical protein